MGVPRVLAAPGQGEGVDIGTPLMGGEALLALVLLAAAVAREVIETIVGYAVRRKQSARVASTP